MTDSDFLIDFLFDGNNPDDTPLACTINRLKLASFNCTEMRVTCDYEDSEVIRQKMDEVNVVLVETWQYLLNFQKDFKDLIDHKFYVQNN